MRHAGIAALLFAVAASAAAQQPSPSFDVASVKANHSGLPAVNFGMPGGGRFTATNAPLRELIRVAFDNVPDFLIVDAPDWIRVERFDIVAKAEGSPDREQLFAMIRTLLTDRFNVAVHRETRELPQYALVRAKADGALGPRLRPAAADCAAITAAAQKGTPPPRSERILCGSRNRPGLIAIGGMTMDQIARGLWPQLGRVVVDRTGLQGSYDLDLEFAPDLSTPSDLPSIFTAVQEQLGLKLESTRGPVEVLVIDHVERPKDDSAADDVPKFEVASIKPNREDSNRSNLNLLPGGRLVATNTSLMQLIRIAYGEGGLPLEGNRLVLKEKWIGGTFGGGFTTADRFDIIAKADRELAQAQVPAALRKLLADRFTLVVHHETKELPVYHLTLARADGRLGPKLRRSDVDCSDVNAPAAKNDDGTSKCGFRRLPGSAKGRATMQQLATPFLNGAIDDHRPVEDRTGLAGTFEFDIEWTPTMPIPADAPPAPPVDPNGASLFTALREQLGLKLEPGKQQIDILVVDRAEHPTEN